MSETNEVEVQGQAHEQLKELVKEFYAHDQLAKKEAKLAEPLKAKIKTVMSESDIRDFEHEGVVATYSVQERSNANSEKLLNRLKSMGHDEAIKTVETIDTAVLERLIYDGIIDPDAIADCFNNVSVSVLTVKAAKKKAGA